MEYNIFKNKLNNRIFGDDLNYEILLTVLNNPKRYIGIFRITNAKTKLIQNLTQSCEIKFGDFLEEILTSYIDEMGYENLDKNIGTDEENKPLSADQIFKKDKQIYLIEQKVRDDHDSTKKRGQYANLIKKIRCLKQNFPNQKIKVAMWFSDDSLKKNRKFYKEQITNNTDDLVEISLFYGKEIFENLFERIDIWDELVSHLKQNKTERSNEILSVPDFDTSDEILKALLKMKENEPKLIKNLLSNKTEFIELRKELFPNGCNLKGL
ncbi:HpyAIV family type II restriction enzyme [Campylobacter hyointestinalis]|uniref:HpyAIV family type II restriction enzyme n=1 Tax=Campylobacter hyointestinalis TaxID=198 RepID=UPI002553B3A5|nr:restriction endonuclease [Campylobacter hyointestinalis]MDL2346208.1 restriction endonuclease [Campylobacter hyointestinalis]MDL2347948.1 restriction endonuclease [Campylobacter hyointestinalis]MDL2349691.1 restriction endonuclease [Campylobacter hyointestinalis]MDM1025634.1 restriction endonuclease [Campylobacter hyointestinalis]MDM1027697.1 restriction endonuclease [Campylobacter hyointestinalis]